MAPLSPQSARFGAARCCAGWLTGWHSQSMRRPLHSAQLLLEDRTRLGGFVMETSGFLLYAAALALASLALVQSIEAGGIGILAYVSACLAQRHLTPRTLAGVLVSVFGLLLLGVSLAGDSGDGGRGSTSAILLCFGVSAAVGLVVLALGRRLGAVAVADGVAAGLFFSIGDISTKLITQGGMRVGFLLTLVLGYAIGTGLLQVGYQAGGALTVAGVATPLTNAVPIAAGTILLHEQVSSARCASSRSSQSPSD